MTVSRSTKKESIEEVQTQRSQLQKLRSGEVKHKFTAESLKEKNEEYAKIFGSYQEAISELRELYIRDAGFEQMLQKTVDLFVKNFGYYMAWYGELKTDENVIIPKVWAGKYEEYLDGLRLELDDSKDAKCAMSLAIVNKEPFGYADLEHDKDFEKWRPLALKYGYCSNQAIPLVIDGKSVGAFLIYSTRTQAFGEHLIRYLAGIANELATIVENLTERKKAWEAYSALVDHSLQGLVIFQDECIVFTNQAMAGITGYAVDEMLAASSQQMRAFVHPEDQTFAWRRHEHRLIGKPSPEYYELRGIRKDGTVCWSEIHASKIEYQGKPAIQAAFVDITERKEAEQALQKRTEELTIINEMAIELAVASSRGEVYKLVCEKLRGITGALFTAITRFDSQGLELKVEHFSTDNKFITKANKILGRKVKKLRITLKPQNIELMLSGKAKKLEAPDKMMFGTIPRAMINTLKRVLKIGDVYGLTLHYGGKLLGTMPILMPRQKPSLSIEMLKAFANLVSASLQRIKVEEERVAALRERAVVVDAMYDSVIVLNPDGQIISCNPANLRMFGRSSADEILGRHFSELREIFCDPEEDIPKMLGVFERIIQNGFCEPVEVRVRRVDGIELTISASVSLQRDAMGNPLNVVVILRDITPQKRLQEMEKEAAVNRTAVETIEGMLEAVAIMDLDGTIRQVNSEFERGSGYKKEEIIGKTAIELGIIAKEESQRVDKEIIPKLMNEGLVRNIETVVMNKDGTRFSALMSWRLMKDAQGNPKSIIATVIDITELKRAEEQLREYQKKLQSMASELSLTEERERRHIATGLHDRIVQSLVFTKMKLDKLRLSTIPVDSGTHLEEISDMLDQVIEETQNITYDLGSPTLYELGIEAAIKEWLSEEIEQRHNISTSFKVKGAPISLSEDISGFLFRSVRELLVNAAKHGKAQHIKVFLQKGKDEIRICVEDDGIGFELSEQGVPKDKKCGYGLFSIREHLSHIGGHINIRSELQHGTQVVLVAPSKVKISGT